MTRRLFAFISAVPILNTACTRKTEHQDVFRIGYQKWSTFSILKLSGRLEKTFGSHGVKVEWIEFPAGPPLLEAMNAGSLDIGHTGDSPPLFAQAADIPFVYFGVSSAAPEGSGILVKQNSNIRKAADLRGRRIGFTKGTSAHTMVLRYLEKNGIPLTSITPLYLAPSDGVAALETGGCDAWSAWDPYLASAQQGGRFRTLSFGEGYVEGREFYLASRRIAAGDPAWLTDFLRELENVKLWAKDRTDEINRFLAAETGIPIEAVALAETRHNRYAPQALTQELIDSQQSLADRYLELGLLPHKIRVQEAVGELVNKK